jgi:hypothetical protein
MEEACMRFAQRALAVLALALVMAVGPEVAVGSVQWCAEDPILTFSNGAKLQLVAKYDANFASTVSGPIVWSIEVPSNAGTILVTIPANAAHQEQVTLNDKGGKWDGRGDAQVKATVTVNALKAKFDVVVGANGDTHTNPKWGESNKTVTLSAHTHAGDFTPYQGVTDGATFIFTGTSTVTY